MSALLVSLSVDVFDRQDPYVGWPYAIVSALARFRVATVQLDEAHEVTVEVPDREAVVTCQRQWKTDKGLHVGDTVKRLRQLYPKANQYIGKNWALIRRPFGGTLVPTLLATIKTSRVSAFVIKSPWLLTC